MKKTTLTSALVGVALLATPALAQDQQGQTWIDKADKAARGTLCVLYSAAGRRIAGSIGADGFCKAGTAIYDGAQNLSQRGAARIQEAGRNLRERVQRRRGQ